MPYNNSWTRDYLSNLGQSYRYNAYGAAESQRVQDNSLEEDPDEHESFFYQRWNWALEQATEMFRPIAEKLGEQNVQFNPQNDRLIINDLNKVSEKCKGIVSSDRNNDYFACTEQNAWHGDLSAPYIKPSSTTYLAQEWATDFVENAFNHELSHQALVSVRQMLKKDHQRRRRNGEISLSDETYDAFMRKFAECNSLLDDMDKARLDSKTRKIVIDKKSDVFPILRAIVDAYCQIIRDGMN